jgi:hypothetical protein
LASVARGVSFAALANVFEPARYGAGDAVVKIAPPTSQTAADRATE